MRLDFEKPFDFNLKVPLSVFLDNGQLELIEYERYDGPITVQLLPYGGIQSLFSNLLIINLRGGFLAVSKIKDESGVVMTSKEFIEKVGASNLLNKVLS